MQIVLTLLLLCHMCLSLSIYDTRFKVLMHNSPRHSFNNKTTSVNYLNDNYSTYSVISDQINFQCMIPHVEKASLFGSPQNTNSSQLEIDKTEAIEVIKKFNFDNRGQRIGYRHGFWDYSLTFDYNLYQYHLYQYHPENTQQVEILERPDYLLASWSDKGDDNLFQVVANDEVNVSTAYNKRSDFELITTEEGTKYVSHRLGHGEICDITGLPRTTTINYICNHEVPFARINNIHEWRTCEYILELQSSVFCNHSMWSLPKALDSNDINCYPDIDDDTMLKEIIDLSTITLEPLKQGILIGRDKENKFMFQLLLTKYYNFFDDENPLELQEFLTDVSVGFQLYLNHGKMSCDKTLSGFISPLDQFELITKVFDVDRSHIGNVHISYDESMVITSHFTSDATPSDTNFLSINLAAKDMTHHEKVLTQNTLKNLHF